MTPAKPQISFSTMTTRQKATAGIFVLILLFLIYQIYGLVGGGGSAPPAPVSAPSTTPGAPMQSAQRPPQMPQPAQLPKPQQSMMSQREADLLRMQQATESKYLEALNELQMLKIEREIAETNKAIAAAKLDQVTAEKSIVELLKPPPITTSTYAQGLVSPVSSGAAISQAPAATPAPAPAPATTTVTTTTTIPGPEASYTVISVSQLQRKWSAVVGFQGSLFSVNIGDVLPPDQSKVVAIDKSGIVLEKNGLRKKISLVPII